MNTFIFVSIICIGQSCGFMTSENTITEQECKEYKSDFLESKFSPKVTLAAAQCIKLKEKEWL